MNLPDKLREQLRERMWQIADKIDWLALATTEKSQYYENWTKDIEVGGILQRYMEMGQVRVYIKDSLLKDYPRARRADQEKPFRVLGLDGKVGVTRVFIKPHGRLLGDGRIICWGRAADWKTILMAVFERSLAVRGATPHAAILTESAGKLSDNRAREIVAEAAKRLRIEKVVWDS
jgi:hypothetical protein